MSSIHYRFRSSSEFETITFDGPSITVSDLREAIMQQKKIAKSPGHTLEITNAQSKEVYEVDSSMVPKNSSVIIKRVPVQRLEAVTAATSGLSKEEEELTEIAFAKLTKTADLVNAKASENDKIKAMMKQSTDDFNPSQYVRRAPPTYPCYRCNGKGHYVKDCPTQGDPRYSNAQYAPRPPSGIPRAYYMMNMMRLKQEEELIKNLRAMQPANSRFSPVCSSDVVDQTKIPSELQCPMCKKLFTDVVVTPCCGFSYCDECIRNYLVEHDLVCVCQETTSPDNLIANKSLRMSVSNFRNKKKAEMKSVPPSPIAMMPAQSICNGPFGTTEVISAQAVAEATIIQAQQPPDVHSETSQSSMTNGLTGTESGQDSDTGYVNSPKKVMLDVPDVANSAPANAANGNPHSPVLSQQVGVPPTPNVQVVTSLPVSQTNLISSQVLSHPYPGSAGQAIYSNVQTAIRPGLILPQQQRHLVPGAVVGSVPYGLNIPPGARIVKRLVPVPVGPRISPNQIRLAQQAHALAASGGMNPHLMDPIRIRAELIKANEKRRGNEAESPIMPLTEDEFYLWQQQFKKRTAPTRRRQHRSTSRDGSRERERFRSRSRSRSSRSRSRSPTSDKKRRFRHKEEEEATSSPRRSKKKYDSADDSSKERQKKKEKIKKRHRETSQESGISDTTKPRARVDKKIKYRELPEHIKREVDEFEFDNELEFDEELRKLRKESKMKKKVVEDVDMSSPEDLNFPKSNPSVRSRSSSLSKPSRSLSPSKSPKLKTIDIDVKDGIVIDSPDPKKIDSEEGIPTPADKNVETDSLQVSENDGNKKPVENVLPSNVDEEPNVDKLDNGEVSSTLTSPTVEENIAKPIEAKPKKKTKIIKKKVIRIIKVARKKQKSTSSTTDAPTINTPETPTEVPITAETPITAAETPDTIVVVDETNERKVENEVPSKSENNDSVIEVPPPVSQENELIFNNSVIITDQPLPENSRWETSGKPMQSSVSVHRSKIHELPRSSSPIKKPKTLNIDGVALHDGSPKTEKKKSRKEHSEKAPEKTDNAKMKSTISKEKMLALKQMHAHKTKVISAEVRAKKEAEKRAYIEKAKRTSMEKAKSDGKEGNVEEDERRRRREKYLLLKQRRAKERAVAERQRTKKIEGESDTVKSKVKTKKCETDHGEDHTVMDEDKCIQIDKKSDQSSYKPADAKLKTISEITKKRLKQGDIGEPKKNEIEDEASDVLKSKVTSIKTVIAAAEKRRVIKTSVSEEERELTTTVIPEEHHVRRIVKIDDRKKSLVSKVEKLASATEKSITIRGDHEKRRHRDEDMERRRREKSLEREREEVIERDRYERRVRIREEDSLRREMKEKIRLREVEKDRQQREKEEQQRVKSLEKDKLEGLERERQALKEREKLERKLKRERQLREQMIREKEEKEEKEEKDRKRKDEGEKKRQDKRKVTVTNNSDSGNSDEHKSSKRKRDKTKPGYIIQIIDSDKSDSDSDSSEDEDREKKKKKRNKRRKEKKKKKKKTDETKSEEKEDSEDSSEEEEERKKKKKKKEESDASSDDDEDRKKKKRKKHKRKHKKHRKVKKTKKKSKKKKAKKEKSESESEDKQVEQSGEDESGEESATESTKEVKSSSSSGGESVASSSDDKKEKDTEESSSKTEDVSADGEGRTHSKERSDEPREDQPKGKPESPRPERDHRLKEISEIPRSERDTPRSERDSRSKEKSETPRSERDNRSKEKSESVRSERDIRNREKTETVRSERDARCKEKSDTPRIERDNRNVEKSVEIQSERDKKARAKSKDPQLKRDPRSKSKSEEFRPERDVKSKGKSEERRYERTPSSSCNKESSNDRLPTLSKFEDSRAERVRSASPLHMTKRNDTTADDLELDYNEDLGDLDDDVLYGDLDFADDEQTNPVVAESKLKSKKKSEDFEDGEILDEELFSASRKDTKMPESFESNDSMETETEIEHPNGRTDALDKIEKDTNITEPNDIEIAIENAVDDAINELSLEIECDSERISPKLKRTKSMQDGTTQVPKRVLRKR